MADEKQQVKGDGEQGDGAKLLTQEQVNVLMGQARQEERSKYGDYESLKKQAAEFAEVKKGQMTEAQKFQAQAAEWQKKAIEADSRVAQASINAEIKVKAAQKGIVDPDAALALVNRNEIAYDEDKGVVGVDEALEVLMSSKPYLKANAQPLNVNLNPGGTKSPAPVRLTEEQKLIATKLGVKPEDYAKNLTRG